TIHTLFTQHAEADPEAIAVVCDGEFLSYGELNRRANQVANVLRTEYGVGPDVLVGLCVERSPQMLVGILGILKAGGGYVPLSPDYPQERLDYMIQDSGVRVVLSTASVSMLLSNANTNCLLLDEPDVFSSTSEEAPEIAGLNGEHLAYVIYTSGTTGQPKGVMVSHDGVVNLVSTLKEVYELTGSDRILQFAPMSFDMSVEEIFGALCNGCGLVLRNDDWLSSAQDFWSSCEASRVSVLNLPPAFWQELVRDSAAVADCVRHISVGGDKISEHAVQQWFARTDSHPRLMNAYGPTEYTVNATLGEVSPSVVGSIGRAVKQTQLLVLSGSGALCPPRVPGELYIGGVGLARGYLNKPDMTASRFVANPYYKAGEPGS
ncbi:amino acid adenylation domain-containing protein, partial [Pseudoalteromonas sp. MMG007]|uniref:amino acid adenylation domain-containing protein n=1 Tax=Pseudoalteromonas sp. MMG007 TaxID=2822684 RepID=UPI001B380E53